MENKLPKGWDKCRLSDVLAIQNGYAFPSREFKKAGIPLIRQSNLAGERVSLEKCVYLDRKYAVKKKDFVLRKGDILIGMSGSIGKLCRYDLDEVGLQNQRTGKVVLRGNRLKNRFIWHYLNTVERKLQKKGKGLGVSNVSADDIESLDILLPPIEQQERIAYKLDSLLAKVKDAQSRLDKIPIILGRFRQSILAAAFSGELTKEWRKKNKIDTDWQEIELREVLANLKYGTAKKCFREEMKHPVLRIPNVVQGYIDSNDLKYTDLDKKEYESLRLEPDDILLIRSNGSVSLVGRTALVTDKEKGMAYAGYLIRLRVKKDLIMPEFLQYQFQSYAMRLQIELPARSTSGVNNINSEEVKNLRITLPAFDEQKEVVRRLKSSFAFIDKNEGEFNKAKSYTEKLEQSILAKAFRGELVL